MNVALWILGYLLAAAGTSVIVAYLDHREWLSDSSDGGPFVNGMVSLAWPFTLAFLAAIAFVALIGSVGRWVLERGKP